MAHPTTYLLVDVFFSPVILRWIRKLEFRKERKKKKKKKKEEEEEEEKKKKKKKFDPAGNRTRTFVYLPQQRLFFFQFIMVSYYYVGKINKY
jgi:hypothetical protein